LLRRRSNTSDAIEYPLKTSEVCQTSEVWFEVNVIQSVIFDLGGTLLSFDGDAPDWRGMEARGSLALYRYLTDRGDSLPEREFVEAMWEGMCRGWEEAMAGRDNACLPSIISVTTACFGISLNDKARMQAARVYASGVENGLVPLEGAREVLQGVKARGLRLGLLSNTTWPGQFHLQELERFGLIEFFDVMAFTCELGVWKPDAAAFHHVTERLGVQPAEAVFVGDSVRVDVSGAQKAGLRAVWISTRGLEPGDVKPDATIYRLAGLPIVLDQLNG
jgi:putative hydrolase of the HAD superfamily